NAQVLERNQDILVLLKLRDVPEGDVGRGASLDAGIEDTLVARGLGREHDTALVDDGLQDREDVLFLKTRPLVEQGDFVTLSGAHAIDRAGSRLFGLLGL